MSGGATILHADLDAFYASVEQRDDPGLRGRPVIVGGGVVLAASYEARAYGVRTAMGGGQARRLCPRAVVVPPRMSAYSAASKAVFAVFRATTPLVEGLSIDEAFLDVDGLRRSPVDVAVRLRREVAEEIGLPITVGVARTKFLAKVASGVAKPDGLLVVPPDGELEFLRPLPVRRLWGVGRATAEKLARFGVTTVGEVADMPESTLVSLLGPGAGRHLHALARNRDPRPVRTGVRRRSMGSQRALGRRRRSPEELDAILVGIVDRLGGRLRKARRVCRTVTLRLRFEDFARATRSRTLPQATADTPRVLETARGLLAAATPMIETRGLTLIGVSLGNLHDARAVQLALPFDQAMAVDGAVDGVRERFGSAAITRGVLLGRDQGMSVPLLPD
ncbi:DNA polymerase IV [Actinomadura soli]|uniref:DNA polymerase IV n=1 Tax=Actinomadura soli TaxID=2508997 RepID=UPI001E521385|nr:DNA polymerase IV [Actinomadura soli]